MKQWGRFSSIVAADATGRIDFVTTDTATITGAFGAYGTVGCMYSDPAEDHGTFLCWEADGIDIEATYTMETRTLNFVKTVLA